MHKQKFNNQTTTILKRLPLLLIIGGISSTNFLTGCASTNRRDDAIVTILEKENVLIEKVKAERAQPEIVAAISANAVLQKAEAHLSTSLDEIKKANDKVSKKIIKRNVKETENGQN